MRSEFNRSVKSHSNPPTSRPTHSMSYTPKFQEVLDECKKMRDLGKPDDQVQEFFQETVRNLGAYERINNLYRIRPKRAIPGQKSRFQFFRMNKMQDAYFKKQTNRDLILKMRQGGVTTLSCIIALDKCLWEQGVHTAIMAHVQPNVKKYFRITKNAFECFQRDWGLLYPVSRVVDNVNEIRIRETNSELLVCTETKGLTLDFLHIAEACFVPDARISESLESVPLSGQIIMESTPDTAQGMFYEMWELYHKSKEYTFTGHFFAWWFQYPEEEDCKYLKAADDFKYSDTESALVEQHDLTKDHMIWRRLKINEAGGDIGEFKRKYPEDPMTCFLSGSSGVFPAQVLAALWKNERVPAFVGDLRIETKVHQS